LFEGAKDGKYPTKSLLKNFLSSFGKLRDKKESFAAYFVIFLRNPFVTEKDGFMIYPSITRPFKFKDNGNIHTCATKGFEGISSPLDEIKDL
jgi:hypothetical protein